MRNYLIIFISVYKFLSAFIKLLIGGLILYFRGNPLNFILFIFKKEILEDPTDLFSGYLLGHIAQPSVFLTIFLALALIIFSLSEMIFTINLFLQKKSGAIGLFVTSILWVPIEFLFISRFLLAPKTIGIVLDIVILILLFQMMAHSRKYFKD